MVKVDFQTNIPKIIADSTLEISKLEKNTITDSAV